MTRSDVEKYLLEVSETLSKEPGSLAVIARGSYVTGMMSPTSDVDVYVITDNVGPVAQHIYRADLDFHVRRLPEQYLEYQITELNLRYLGFFLHARVLTDEGGVFARLRERVSGIYVRDVYRAWHKEVEHQVSDAAGQLELGNFENALYLIRFAGHLLAQVCLLWTETPTYKHKDVVPLLASAAELVGVRGRLLEVMNLDSPDPRETGALLALLHELVAATRETPDDEHIRGRKLSHSALT